MRSQAVLVLPSPLYLVYLLPSIWFTFSPLSGLMWICLKIIKNKTFFRCRCNPLSLFLGKKYFMHKNIFR